MADKRVLLVSHPDTASRNIQQGVLSLAPWAPTQHEFDGHPVLRLEDPQASRPVFMVEIKDMHIHREGIGEALEEVLGGIDCIMVLSRHRAASGRPSLTAHPVGNPGPRADAGGEPRTATPTHPHVLSAALRALSRRAHEEGLEHEVTLEATHHGPRTRVPLLFIEVGSAEEHWKDPAPGRVVAQAALEAIRHEAPPGTRTIMGVGGPHYAPRFVRLLHETPVSVGHVLAAHHFKGDDEAPGREVLAAFLEASTAPGEPSVHGVYVDRKSLPGPVRRRVMEDLEALGATIVRTADLKD